MVRWTRSDGVVTLRLASPSSAGRLVRRGPGDEHGALLLRGLWIARCRVSTLECVCARWGGGRGLGGSMMIAVCK